MVRITARLFALLEANMKHPQLGDNPRPASDACKKVQTLAILLLPNPSPVDNALDRKMSIAASTCRIKDTQMSSRSYKRYGNAFSLPIEKQKMRLERLVAHRVRFRLAYQFAGLNPLMGHGSENCA
jgi:hypothetical protein